MKPAIIIIDMLEGNYEKPLKGVKEEEKIIPGVRDLLKKARGLGIPVIFACDSFMQNDFIFRGRMKPHAIRGTEGTRPLAELEPAPSDIILDKRRFSAFFKTDLDQTLRTLGIDTVAVGGVNTHFCVLATAFDSVCHDFNTVILEDMSASFKQEIHENFLNAYRNSAIYPIFRVMMSTDFIDEFLAKREAGNSDA
ncbi:MAG TPA: isochorismatase family cysteine hydrolase [Syntrophorhabdaceae bacterium]|nr:isochorismatase family cysteine hydrolase [Syntrophorhabdaceae bacterium]